MTAVRLLLLSMLLTLMGCEKIEALLAEPRAKYRKQQIERFPEEVQVVMLRAGELSIGVPANLVEVVRRVPQADLAQAYSTGQFDVGGGVLVPFYWSGGLLQSSLTSQEVIGKTRPVVVLRSENLR